MSRCRLRPIPGSAAGRALLLAAALLGGSPLDAAADTVTVTVRATGADLGEATNNALIEAVRQVNGVSLTARQLMQTRSISGAIDDAQGGRVEFEMNQRQDTRFGATARGHVAGYELVSSSAGAYGHEVVAKVQVHRYQAPGLDTGQRRRLAVVPLVGPAARADFFGPIRIDALAGELSQALVTQFVQARRFAVLDRQSWDVLGKEQALLASADTPVSEKAKLGRILGADYLLLGEVLRAEAVRNQTSQKLTGMVSAETRVRIAINLRVVVPATGEIRFADTLELELTDADGDALASRTRALSELARRVVGVVLDRIYPMQVLTVADGGEVVLNQGGQTLAVGEQLLLVQRGGELTDPYTRESLGRVETVIGRLEIVRVDGRVSYARVVGSPSAPVQAGQLARRDGFGASDARSAVAPPTDRHEGVRLPFDRR